jgi:hypothetical protein
MLHFLNAEYYYDECHIFTVMLTIIMLKVIKLSVTLLIVMLSIIMMNVSTQSVKFFNCYAEYPHYAESH